MALRLSLLAFLTSLALLLLRALRALTEPKGLVYLEPPRAATPAPSAPPAPQRCPQRPAGRSACRGPLAEPSRRALALLIRGEAFRSTRGQYDRSIAASEAAVEYQPPGWRSREVRGTPWELTHVRQENCFKQKMFY